ncbi:type III secretion system stalk subunit SctO [Terasakiella pusilla]|jgi:chromosome segregation ATPase|uniref:type III secretion system stalk subunit SctO n=1 Tax=Terasakiella pusilla TaxID=64973 RepID=UPI000571C5DE|nr:YscO family type III secretion system apparatus protein [Terasakiella pusilla]
MSAFKTILELKVRKKDKAQSQLRAKRLVYDQAVEAVQAAQRKHQDFARFVVSEQDRLYDEIEQKLVQLDEIDELKEKISDLRARESQLFLAIGEAEKEKEVAGERVKEAQLELDAAMMKVSKFEELVEIEKTEEYLKAQEKEDLALEEFRPIDRLSF